MQSSDLFIEPYGSSCLCSKPTEINFLSCFHCCPDPNPSDFISKPASTLSASRLYNLNILSSSWDFELRLYQNRIRVLAVTFCNFIKFCLPFLRRKHQECWFYYCLWFSEMKCINSIILTLKQKVFTVKE